MLQQASRRPAVIARTVQRRRDVTACAPTDRYAGASYRNRTDGKCLSYGGVVSGRGYYRAWASGLHWCR
jgi:hypothetical protein